MLSDETNPDDPAIRFSIVLPTNQTFPAHALPILLKNFALLDLTEVTELDFKFIYTTSWVPELATFTMCLPVVEIIETDERSLPHLILAQAALRIADTDSIMCPALEVLRLYLLGNSWPQGSWPDCPPDPITEFVMECVILDDLPEMAFIAEVDSMKVIWRRRGPSEILGYVCCASGS